MTHCILFSIELYVLDIQTVIKSMVSLSETYNHCSLSLSRLPPISNRTMYRDVRLDMNHLYPPGKTFVCQGRQKPKNNGEIRVEILTRKQSGKAHILTNFISVRFSTQINAFKINEFLHLQHLCVTIV